MGRNGSPLRQAEEILARHLAVRVRRRPFAQKVPERRVTRRAPERFAQQRTSLVHPVVKHLGDAGIGQHQILRQRGLTRVVALGPLDDSLGTRCLRPDPLGVGAEALVQPDVLPARDRPGRAERIARTAVPRRRRGAPARRCHPRRRAHRPRAERFHCVLQLHGVPQDVDQGPLGRGECRPPESLLRVEISHAGQIMSRM